MTAVEPGRREVIHATGHENVTARHRSTVEVTTDDYLTPAGDCIIGIEADRAPRDFDPRFVEACRDANATITLTVAAADRRETIVGSGHPSLTFDDGRSLVARTSTYVDDRTVMVDADRAAAGLDRELVRALADGAPLTVTIGVEAASEP